MEEKAQFSELNSDHLQNNQPDETHENPQDAVSTPAESMDPATGNPVEERLSVGTASPEEMEKLQQERDEYLQHLQRLQAEFDNYRKRVQREKAEMRDYLIQDLLIRLVEVADNMDRALHSGNSANDVNAYRQGVEMVFQQLTNVLKDQGLNRIETAGQVFDPRFHEAIGQVESDEHNPGTIVREILPGYIIKERVLRASKVQVAAKPSSVNKES